MSIYSNEKGMVMTMAKLNDINYYNNTQNIIRVKIEANDNYKYYDFPLLNTGEYPNPALHHVLLFTYDDVLDKVRGSILPNDPRLDYLPGYSNLTSLEPRVVDGYAILINTNAKKDRKSVV